MPNLSDAVLEAGGTVYGRAAITDKFSSLIEIDSSGYVTIGNGLTGLKSKAGHVAVTTAAGIKFAAGSTALDGSNPTPVTTGLTTVSYFVPVLQGTSAPGDSTSVLTVGAKSGGSVDVYAWKNTGGTDPTLVASTGTESFDWIAVGT